MSFGALNDWTVTVKERLSHWRLAPLLRFVFSCKQHILFASFQLTLRDLAALSDRRHLLEVNVLALGLAPYTVFLRLEPIHLIVQSLFFVGDVLLKQSTGEVTSPCLLD